MSDYNKSLLASDYNTMFALRVNLMLTIAELKSAFDAGGC